QRPQIVPQSYPVGTSTPGSGVEVWEDWTMATVRKPVRRSPLGSIVPTRNAFKVRYWRNGSLHTAGRTFSSYKLADDWLADEQRLIDRDEWTPPAQRRAEAEATTRVNALMFGEYSE